MLLRRALEMLKKFLLVSLLLSLTMALIMVSPTAPETYSAQASCIGCTENVITTVQLQALLAALVRPWP